MNNNIITFEDSKLGDEWIFRNNNLIGRIGIIEGKGIPMLHFLPHVEVNINELEIIIEHMKAMLLNKIIFDK